MANSNSPKPETDPATEDVTEEDLDNVSGGGAAGRVYTNTPNHPRLLLMPIVAAPRVVKS